MKIERFINKNVKLRNMEIIAKVSRGSKMDQIYLPKNRFGLYPGSYALVKEIAPKKEEKLFFYNLDQIEKIKIVIIKEIFSLLNKYNIDNIIITGSFIEEGFNFNDIDIILISDKEFNIDHLHEELKNKLGINPHLIVISSSSLLNGISQDPLFQTMLSSYISKKRFIYHIKPDVNFKLLDLNLLKSKLLIENFDILTGEQKLDLLRNLISISLFINKNNFITKKELYSKIKELFGKDIFNDLKNNLLGKNYFIKKYRNIYNKTFELILKGIKNESK